MTAERHGSEISPVAKDGQRDLASDPLAPAVSKCPGHYTLSPAEDGFADCDVCGITGEIGEPCDQLVIE